MAVDLALAKQQCRVLHDHEDTLIAQYLAASIAWVENYTGKLLTRREVTQDEGAFGSYLSLHYGPDPDALTIVYIDSDEAPQTIADAKIVQGRAYPASAWPAMAVNTGVTLTYTAGFDSVPADLDSAVLLLVGEYYSNREAGEVSPAVSIAVESLCRPYRSLRV